MNSAQHSGVKVPAGLHLQSRFFAATAGLWKKLGSMETAAVREEMETVSINRPIYVTSLPRSGTTILTEMLDRHADISCHRYSDFPNVWTPYWRNYLLQSTGRQAAEPQERAHQDGIKVSNDSPEAVEEVLWMNFFPGAHDETVNNVLDGSISNKAFDEFYRDHIRKLLAIRKAKRYLAKGNYNVSRLLYILGLFPDAKFLLPVRNPVNHIASLIKQHRLFLKADSEDSRVGRQLAMAGHFEFGPGRTFVNFGDPDRANAIREAWSGGREVEGWAHYWSLTYSHILQQMDQNEALDEACLLFRYEDYCEHSAGIIDTVLEHCELEQAGFAGVKEEYVQFLTQPDYYRPDFSEAELGTIDDLCGPVLEQVNSRSCKAV